MNRPYDWCFSCPDIKKSLHRHTRGNAAKGPMAFHISSLLATPLCSFSNWTIGLWSLKLVRKNSLEIINNWHGRLDLGKKAGVKDSITLFLVYNKDFIDRWTKIAKHRDVIKQPAGWRSAASNKKCNLQILQVEKSGSSVLNVIWRLGWTMLWWFTTIF